MTRAELILALEREQQAHLTRTLNEARGKYLSEAVEIMERERHVETALGRTIVTLKTWERERVPQP